MSDKFHYSPDVEERKLLDNGFSKGWGMHFPTSEDYWFEAHVHYDDADGVKANMENILKSHEEVLDEFNVLKSLVIIRAFDEETGWKPVGNEEGDFFSIKQLIQMTEFLKKQDRFYWAAWIRYKDPNISLLNACIDAGVSCIKLHNAYMITEAGDPKFWYSDKWQDMFKRIENSGLPILWHVTQRLSAAPYRGMGANSYWKEGVPKGVTYTNQYLLDIFLDIVEKYPNINFIGAHQLHLGWDRLGELLNKYRNLYIDTSIGCFLKTDDEFYCEDKEYLKNFFIKYYNRILFATDVYYKNPKMTDWKFRDEYKGHIRFIKRLNLPNDVLQAISHENAERLYIKKGQ